MEKRGFPVIQLQEIKAWRGVLAAGDEQVCVVQLALHSSRVACSPVSLSSAHPEHHCFGHPAILAPPLFPFPSLLPHF